MHLKIPKMQFDKKINPEEGKKLLDFADQYTKAFQDGTVERILDKVVSSRFLGKGQFEILDKRRKNFSDKDISSPQTHYVNKYKNIVTKLVVSIEDRSPTNHFKLDLDKIQNLLDFYIHQGYFTKKQRGLISFLLKGRPPIDFQSIPTHLKFKIDDILNHHIKKDFMKTKTTGELVKILTDKEKKQATPKKKNFLTLSQIRSKLSN